MLTRLAAGRFRASSFHRSIHCSPKVFSFSERTPESLESTLEKLRKIDPFLRKIHPPSTSGSPLYFYLLTTFTFISGFSFCLAIFQYLNNTEQNSFDKKTQSMFSDQKDGSSGIPVVCSNKEQTMSGEVDKKAGDSKGSSAPTVVGEDTEPLEFRKSQKDVKSSLLLSDVHNEIKRLEVKYKNSYLPPLWGLGSVSQSRAHKIRIDALKAVKEELVIGLIEPSTDTLKNLTDAYDGTYHLEAEDKTFKEKYLSKQDCIGTFCCKRN